MCWRRASTQRSQSSRGGSGDNTELEEECEVTMCKAVTPADRRASKKYSVISITSFTVTSDTDPAPAPARTPAPPPAPSEPAWSWAVLAASFLCLCVLDGIR